MSKNYKVRCIGYTQNDEKHFTIGKIYDVSSNKIIDDNYHCYNEFGDVKDDIVTWLSRWYKFERIDNESIHISIDGNKIIAVMKKDDKVIKRSEAKCSLNDKFDFETGAKLAFERLFEKKSKSKFIPHLEYTLFGLTDNYGEIGKPTNYKDSNGEALYIGDTVNIIFNKITFTDIPVVENRGKQFIMGISDKFYDNSKYNYDDCKIVKTKSYKDFKHNDKTRFICTDFCYKLIEE